MLSVRRFVTRDRRPCVLYRPRQVVIFTSARVKTRRTGCPDTAGSNVPPLSLSSHVYLLNDKVQHIAPPACPFYLPLEARHTEVCRNTLKGSHFCQQQHRHCTNTFGSSSARGARPVRKRLRVLHVATCMTGHVISWAEARRVGQLDSQPRGENGRRGG